MNNNDLIEEEIETMLASVRANISLNCINREQLANKEFINQSHVDIVELGISSLIWDEFKLESILKAIQENSGNENFQLVLPDTNKTIH